MAEEQIDKLTVEVESVGGDDKAIADMRKQLEKLGRVDLSGTIRQLGNLKQALGYLGTVDESVKSMLDNMVKLGLSANRVSPLKKQLDAISQSARQSKEEIAEVIDRAMQLQNANPTAPSGGSAPKREPVTNQKAYGYDQSAIDYIEEYAQELDKTNAGHKKNAASAKEMGKSATEALNKTDSAAKKVQKSTSKLGDAFVRIVRFKIVAATMQAVIQSAKEGTTALGEFDDSFKDTLNSYSAASKAMSGGLGLALAPALEAAAPLIEYIADGIGSIGTGISMISAILKGDDFYNAVKPVKQIKEEMAAAEKKANDVKHLISGFDELNIFEPKDEEKVEIDPFVKKPLDFGEDSMKEDLATLVKYLAVAGGAAGIIAGLKKAFSGKNEELFKQTELTKEDAKETAKLGETALGLIPAVNGAANALGVLGGISAAPKVDGSGVLMPVPAIASAVNGLISLLGILDGITAKPSVTVDTTPLLDGLGDATGALDSYITIVIPAKELDADPSGVTAGVDGAASSLGEFINIIIPGKNLDADPSGVTAGVAAANAEFGEFVNILIPAKNLEADPSGVIIGVERAGAVVGDYVQIAVPAKALDGDPAGLLNAIEASGLKLKEFANSPDTTIVIKGDGLPFGTAIEQSKDKANSFADAFGVTMGNLFDALGVDWTALMGGFEKDSSTSGANILSGLESTFDAIFADWGLTMDEFTDDTTLTGDEIKALFVSAFSAIVGNWATSLGTMNTGASTTFGLINTDFSTMLGLMGTNMGDTFKAATQDGRTKWSSMLNAFIESSGLAGKAIATKMGNSFDAIEKDWSGTMSTLVTDAETAFSGMNTDFKAQVDDMVSYYNEQMGSLGGGGEKEEYTDVVIEKEFASLQGSMPSEGLFSSGRYSPVGKTGGEIADYVEEVLERNTELTIDLVTSVGGSILAGNIAGAVAAGMKKNALSNEALKGLDNINKSLKGSGAAIDVGKTQEAVSDFIDTAKKLFGGQIGMRANGGLVTSGEFFMARENGIPEYIGSFGHQTGVANNEQIVSGIAGGVEMVLAAYIPQIIRAIEENATSVNIGDEQIARSAARGAARYRTVTGQALFR